MRIKESKSYRKKVFISFFVILLVPILTVLMIFFRVRIVVREQVLMNSRNTLNQFSQYVDNVLEVASDICVSIASNTKIGIYSEDYVEQNGKQAYFSWEIAQQLRNYDNEKYHDLLLYYPGTGYVISSRRSTLLIEDYYNVYYKEKGDYWDEFYQVVTCDYRKPTLCSINGKDSRAFQCIAMRISNSRNENEDFIVVVVLNQNYWQTLLNNLYNSLERCEFSVLNGNSELIFATDVNVAEQVLNGDIYRHDVYEYESSGYTIISQDSEKISGYYSYIIPNSCFESMLGGIYVIFSLGILVSLGIGLVVVCWMTRKDYEPINQMVSRLQEKMNVRWDREKNTEFEFVELLFKDISEEKQELHRLVQTGEVSKRREFILSLLYNKVEPNLISDNIFKDNGLLLYSDCFCVSLLQVESIGDMGYELASFVVANVLEELLNNSCVGYVVPLNDTKHVVLINMKRYEEYETVRDLLEEGVRYLREVCYLEFTIGISSVQEGLLGIRLAYEEAELALRYRYLLGTRIVIEYSRIAGREFQYPKDIRVQVYSLLNNYLEEKTCSLKAARQMVAECEANYEIDENVSLKTIECFQFEVVSAFCRILQQNGCWNQEWKKQMLDLMGSPSYEVFKAQFGEILVKISVKKQEMKKNEDVCSYAREYIDTHYSDSQLSLPLLGDMLEITPYYLSSLFRDKYNQTIPEYIASTRISHAKELLRNTTDTIQIIAQNTGFQESRSFIRVFKRMEGMTPGDYRSLFE